MSGACRAHRVQNHCLALRPAQLCSAGATVVSEQASWRAAKVFRHTECPVFREGWSICLYWAGFTQGILRVLEDTTALCGEAWLGAKLHPVFRTRHAGVSVRE